MKTKVLHILCEGQTEQSFADKVLKPYLQEHGVASVKSTMVTTNRKKNMQGGMLSFQQAKQDLSILFMSNQNDEYTSHIFTTMFDFYALPNDFPNYSEALKIQDKYQMIDNIEVSFAQEIMETRFIPYVQLHEFEALVFCGIDFLKLLYPGCDKSIKILNDVLDDFGNPELINHGINTAPSKRIIHAIEFENKQKYKYNKPKSGKFVTESVGIDKLRNKCPHFNQWIEKIKTFDI